MTLSARALVGSAFGHASYTRSWQLPLPHDDQILHPGPGGPPWAGSRPGRKRPPPRNHDQMNAHGSDAGDTAGVERSYILLRLAQYTSAPR